MWSITHCSIDNCVANIHNKTRPKCTMEIRQRVEEFDENRNFESTTGHNIGIILLNY